MSQNCWHIPFFVHHPDGSEELVPFAASDIQFDFGPLATVIDSSVAHEGGVSYSMDVVLSEFAPVGPGSLIVRGHSADRAVSFELTDAFEVLPPDSPIIIITPPVGTTGDLTTIVTTTVNMTVDADASIAFEGGDVWVLENRAEGENLLRSTIQLPSDVSSGLRGVTVRGRANGRPVEAHGVFRLRRR